MAVPSFTWEAAFGSLPADSSYTWVADITANVGSNSFTRGKNSDLDKIEAGSGSLVLLDDEGDFDPRNAASPYYPDVRPMVPIRQYATLAGVDYPLCIHFVEQWPRTRDGGIVTRNLRTVDGFAILATAPLANLSLGVDTTGAHIDDVLDAIGWPAGARLISSGAASVVAQSWAETDGTSALSYMQEMSSNEAGLLYMDGQNRVVFLGRADLLGPPFNAIQAYFSDDPADGQFVYAASVPVFAIDRVFNDWTGTRPGGTTPQNAQDATSIGMYRDRPKQIQTLLTNDSDVLATMQSYLSYYKDPRERLAQITVIPGEDSACWVACLPLAIGDRIAVTETPVVGSKRTDEYLIESVTLARQPGSDAGAAFTYSIFPTDAGGTGGSVSGFILDDPALGIFDTSTLGF
jgi:hypothetical protein